MFSKIKNINKCFLLIFFLSCNLGYASYNKNSTEIQFTFDEYKSSYMGSSLMQSTFDIYSYYFPHNNKGKGLLPGTIRTLRVGTDLYLALFLSMVKHEYFGHGARGREFNRRITRYEFNLDGSGSTSFVPISDNALLNEFVSGRLLIRENTTDLAGMESSDVMANSIAMQIFSKKTISVGWAAQYFANAFDQINYISITKGSGKNDDGNDIVAYRNNVNALYANNKQGMIARYSNGIFLDPKWDHSVNNPTVLKNSDLQRGMYISLFDPLLWYSVYANMNYIFTGNSRLKIPVINIDKFRYLPRIRTVLAPYGISTQLQNYLSYDKYDFVLTIQGGKTANQSYYTFGIESGLIRVYRRLSVGAKIFTWLQPELYSSYLRGAKRKIGSLMAVKLGYKFNRDFGLNTIVGYKTRGYVQGEILNTSLVFRAGFSYILR